MSVNPRELERKSQPPSKPLLNSGTFPVRSKDQEIENLKRLLANISQRLDALKSR